MISEEEKKAIESLKNISIYMGDNYTFSQQGIRNLRENLRIVLPVIETQSKEIEELKARKYMYNTETGEISQIPLNDNYIHKDKIKAKIEELEKYFEKQVIQHEIEVLQSLIEKE